MKFRKDKDILIYLGMSAGMILLGLVLSIFIRPLPIGLILGGLILFISGLYAATKPKTEVMMDERIIRINERAGYHAYWIIMAFVGFLWMADVYFKLNMKFIDGVIPIALIGVYAFFILRYYFGKKGEI